MQKQVDQYLSAKKAAKLLDVNPKTLMEWGRQGRIPRVVFHNRFVRFRVKDLEDYIEKHTEKAWG